MSMKPPTEGTPSTATFESRIDSVESDSLTALRGQGGRQGFTQEIDAPLVPQAPTLTWSQATSFASNFNGSAITSRVHVPFDDDRLAWIGGTPAAYTSAGYGTDLGGVSRSTYAGGLTTFDVLSFMCFDLEGDYCEIVLRGDSSADYRLWIDGRPHAATPQDMLPAGGVTGGLYLLGVQFASRAKRTIKVEMQRGLTGGVLVGPTDTVSPPAGVKQGGGLLVVGDSYSAGANIGPIYSYALRLARRLGLDNFYVCGIGGRGVNVDTVLNGSTTGPKYRASLIAERALIPDDVRVIVNQGSTNDGAYSVSTGALQAALSAELTALLDYEAAQWPDAQLVMTSTLRCKDPAAGDLTASGIYKTVAEARSDTLYVDQIDEEWFSGTGTEAAPAGDGNADYLIQTDASHPTIRGQEVIGDRIAAALGSTIAAQPLRAALPERAYAYRSAKEPYGSATLTEDDVLRVQVLADSAYRVRALVNYESSTAADFEMGFFAPSGATLLWGLGGVQDLTLSDTLIADGSGSGVENQILVDGVLITDTAGEFGIEAAQDTLSIVNMFDNPTLEVDNAGLTINSSGATSPALASSTDWAADGTHSAKLTGTLAAEGWVGVLIKDAAVVFAVTPGVGYKFSCVANVTDAAQSGYGLYAMIEWRNGATVLSTTLGTLGNISTGVRTIELVGVAPATADGAVVYVLNKSSTASDTITFYIDSIVFASLDTYIRPGSFLVADPLSA